MRSSAPRGDAVKLSVIIPAYNESGTIDEVLRRVFAVKLSADLEVIVVDDGSTDKMEEVIRQAGLPVIYIYTPAHERRKRICGTKRRCECQRRHHSHTGCGQ